MKNKKCLSCASASRAIEAHRCFNRSLDIIWNHSSSGLENKSTYRTVRACPGERTGCAATGVILYGRSETAVHYTTSLVNTQVCTRIIVQVERSAFFDHTRAFAFFVLSPGTCLQVDTVSYAIHGSERRLAWPVSWTDGSVSVTTTADDESTSVIIDRVRARTRTKRSP